MSLAKTTAVAILAISIMFVIRLVYPALPLRSPVMLLVVLVSIAIVLLGERIAQRRQRQAEAKVTPPKRRKKR